MSWLQNIQQQPRQLQHPIACSLHACSTKGSSRACQMQHVTEVDPLQTGALLLEPTVLLQHKVPPPATAEGGSSSPIDYQAASPATPPAASPSPTSVPDAVDSDSVTVKLAASCRLNSSISKPQQAGQAVLDSVLQDRNSTVDEDKTTQTVQQQPVVEKANVVWTETVQLTLLQQSHPASIPAQSCPEGSAAAPVWMMPDFLAPVGSDLRHRIGQGSDSQNDQDQQQSDQVPPSTSTWDARAIPYNDQSDYEEWLEEVNADTGAAGSSHALVMLDLLLPDVQHWIESVNNSNSNSSTCNSILAHPGTPDDAGSDSPAAAVDAAAASTGINVAWLWLGRLLLVGALVTVQLVWHHLCNMQT